MCVRTDTLLKNCNALDVEFWEKTTTKKPRDCTCLSFMVKYFAWSLRDGA